MRVAVLDLGTNTFHLLVGEVSGKKFSRLYKSKIVVKLGEGSIHRNKISARPFRRGIAALRSFASIIEQLKPDRVVAFATSAIRSAKNGEDFIGKARSEAGIEIQVISGDREAELIYFGVKQCISLGKLPSLIMDIGGGSTEFIIADNRKIYWKKSFDIGAARLIEMFKPSDPIKPSEVRELQKFLGDQLSELKTAVKQWPVERLIGSSGSFDTFAEMAGYKFHNRNVLKNISSYKFDLGEFKKLHKIILNSTIEDRLEMKGLVKMRVDMIVIASICTSFVINKLYLKEMYLSKFALKEGIVSQVAKGKI